MPSTFWSYEYEFSGEGFPGRRNRMSKEMEVLSTTCGKNGKYFKVAEIWNGQLWGCNEEGQ